jgi:Exocyst complex component Sec3
MKIAALDGLRKDAKQKYNDALKSYVTQYFGRPLEKLTLFFDGIQQRLATGIKESEIGYQVPVFFVRHLWWPTAHSYSGAPLIVARGSPFSI